MEEQSSAFFPGLGSGFPQAWALCHSQRGENRASLSVSIRARSYGSVGAVLQPLRRRRADPGGQGGMGPAVCWDGGWVSCSGLDEWGTAGLCCVLRSGHCSWSNQGFLLCAGQGGGRSWLWTGKGCSLVCTGAWSCPRRSWDEPGACRTLFPQAIWPVNLHHISALAPVGSILK